MKTYKLKPFPSKAAEQNALFQNWKLKLPTYSSALGVTPSEVVRQAADADIFSYMLNYKTYLKDSVDAYAAWQRAMIRGNVTVSPTPPVFEQVTLPEQHVGGIVTRARMLDQRMKKSPGFTEQIGEDLGMLIANPTPPSPESFTAKIALKALKGGDVRVKYLKHQFPAIRLEWQIIGEPGWLPAGVYTASPAIHLAEGDAKFVPQMRRYRGMMLGKNAEVGNYSPIMTIVTTP